MMYNTSNPAEIYSGTTWELLVTDKYLKTTTGTPLSSGGSNSFNIQKANLPATSIKVNSFNLTTQSHSHMVRGRYFGFPDGWNDCKSDTQAGFLTVCYGETGQYQKDTFAGGGANTGTASPLTENLGSGTAITVTPSYITIRVWKRLS